MDAYIIIDEGEKIVVEDLARFAKQFNALIERYFEDKITPRYIKVAGDPLNIEQSLNLTGFRDSNTVFDFYQARFTTDMDGGVVIDMTDSSGLQILGLNLVSHFDDGLSRVPDIGVLQSRARHYRVNKDTNVRNDRWSSSGENVFFRPRILGNYRKASLSSISAESCVYYSAKIQNWYGKAPTAVLLGDEVEPGFRSAHKYRVAKRRPIDTDGNPVEHLVLPGQQGVGLDGIEAGSNSSTGQTFYSPEFRFDGELELDSKAALIIDGFDDVELYSPQINSDFAPFIFITTEKKGVRGLMIEAMQTVGSKKNFRPNSVFEIALRAGNGVVGLRFHGQILNSWRRSDATSESGEVGTAVPGHLIRAYPVGEGRLFELKNSYFQWTTQEVDLDIDERVAVRNVRFEAPHLKSVYDETGVEHPVNWQSGSL